MAHLPRHCLSYEEQKAGEKYYSDHELDMIVGLLPGVQNHGQRQALSNMLEHYADVYTATANGHKDRHLTGSSEAREWDKLDRAIEKVLSLVRKTEQSDNPWPALKINFNDAAARIAERDGLPDFNAELVEHPLKAIAPGIGKPFTLLYPVEDQIEHTVDRMKWLQAVAREAGNRAKSSPQKPGEPRQAFLRGLKNIVDMYGEGEVTGSIDPSNDDASGPLVDFLFCCFAPLETVGENSSLYQAYLRATKLSRTVKKRRKRA